MMHDSLPATHNARLLLAGVAGTALRQAADLARQSGAQVFQADTVEAALDCARRDGGDLAMVDVDLDIAHFISALRAERIALPVIACGIAASAEKAVAAIRAGARDYVPLPPDRDLIAAAITSVTLRSVDMLGQDPAFVRAVAYGQAMAKSNAAILVRGAPGTGKELAARTIHQTSGRTGPFVTVECAGVAPDILESGLFGHAPGAFPGAVAQRTGRMVEAAHGSIFLREIGALPPLLQARLSEALHSSYVLPVGSDTAVPLSARLIASTTVDLRPLVARGDFRPDLMHRLNLVEVVLPALKDRGADIALLARHFAHAQARENGLSPRSPNKDALALLARHDWPENVRELEAVMHRAVLLSTDGLIRPAQLVMADGTQMGAVSLVDPHAPAAASPATSVDGLVGRAMAEVERELILHTLDHCKGNRTSASSILGISVRTMRNKLREFSAAGYRV